MSVLVDASVWVEHFRRSKPALIDLLALDLVSTHPFVIGELACGTPLAPRTQTLQAISLLNQSQQATMVEIQDFIEREQLYGLGCGLIDISLLTSAVITPDTQLWTLDKRLSDLAQRYGVAYHPKLH
jgi:predicted nucleic acid-binding protein